MPDFRMMTIAWLFLQAISIAGGWIILLFVANPPDVDWRANLDYVMTEDSGLRHVFLGSLLMLLSTVMLIGTYLSPWARGRRVLWVLFAASLANAVPAVAWLDWSSALPFVATPLFAMLAARSPDSS